MLLLAPPVCSARTYVVNDGRITAIGRYVDAVLTPDLARRISGSSCVLGWEQAHRGDRVRRRRKTWQLGIELLTFFGSSIAALSIVVSSNGRSLSVMAAGSVELFAVLLLARQITEGFRLSSR